MNANALAAARAYLEAANPAAGAKGPTGADAGGFGEMVAEAMQGAVEAGQNTEAQIAAVVQGKGDMVDVVTAIAETELAMETMVTVRDRMISAYQEIMNMPI